ncbi:PLANT CADMIUM RESISTANCE 8 protein [Nymphaea thermarum]|nr:PLANT CADMIUM RESISTANCE 8 protein [Nymphaea thermarum]
MEDGKQRKEDGGVDGGAGKGEEEGFLEGMAVVDFDMLCATVALQTRGFSAGKNGGEVEGGGGGGRGGGLQSCPCCTFGKNMRRAGLGSCFLQGAAYLFLSVGALVGYIAFCVTKKHSFLFIAVALTILAALYLGYWRLQIRKQFNIRGSDSAVDDCMNHLLCPCCTLCQETRTLEMNNVRDGVWHGRGDTICIGSSGTASGPLLELRQSPIVVTTMSPEVCSMQRPENSDSVHSWTADCSHSEPLVPPTS